MKQGKFFKITGIVMLIISLLLPAIAVDDANAVAKYNIKNGQLFITKTGVKAKNFIVFKNTLYKDGTKFKGLRNNIYYKAGKKSSGTFKGVYYVKGVKKVTTGKYNNSYYVKGVKKVSTGLYGSKYYKLGALATGTYKGAYYLKGVEKITTGTYNGAYYVAGEKKVETGVYNGKLYVNGKENTGYYLYNEKLYNGTTVNKDLVLYEDQLYNGADLNIDYKVYKNKLYNDDALNVDYALYDGYLYNDELLNKGYVLFEERLYNDHMLNKGYFLFEDQLYNGGVLNSGIVPFTDDGRELYYNGAIVADGFFDYKGKEELFEKGKIMPSRVTSISVLNSKQIKINFNKSVDEATVIAANFSVAATGSAIPAEVSGYSLSTDKKSVTITFSKILAGDYIVKTKKTILAMSGDSFEAAVLNVEITDKVNPSYIGFKQDSANTFTFNFSEDIANEGTIVLRQIDNTIISDANITKGRSSIKIVFPAGVAVGKDITVSFSGIRDESDNELSGIITEKVQLGIKDRAKPFVKDILNRKATSFDLYFSEEVAGFNEADITINEEALTNNIPLTSVTKDQINPKKYTVTFNKAITGGIRIKVRDTELYGSVAAAAYTDLSGEPGLAYNEVQQFDTDIVKPIITTSVVLDEVAGEYYLVFKSNEDLADFSWANDIVSLEATKGIDSIGKIEFLKNHVNYVSKKEFKLKLADVKYKYKDLHEEIQEEALVAKVSYNLTFPAEMFKDVAIPANGSNSFDYTFTHKDDRVNAAPVLTAAKITQNSNDNNKLTFDFGNMVTLGNSAEVAANYEVVTNPEVAGVAVATVVKAISAVKLASNKVEVTFEPDAFATSKTYTVKLEGIAASNGKLMEVKEFPVYLRENVTPKLKSANIISAVESSYSNVLSFYNDFLLVVPLGNASDKVSVSYKGSATQILRYKYDKPKKRFYLESVLAPLTSNHTYRGGVIINILPDKADLIDDGSLLMVSVATNDTVNTPNTSSVTKAKLKFTENINFVVGEQYEVSVGGVKQTNVWATVLAKELDQADDEVIVSINKIFATSDLIETGYISGRGITLSAANSKIKDASGNEVKLTGADAALLMP